MSWTQFQQDYTRNGMALVLGAGVSVGSGLPGWPALLQRVITATLGDELQVADLLAHGLTLPAIASLIRESLPDPDAFVEHIRAALYQDFPFYPEGTSKSNRRAYVRFTQERNPTLRAVAALCAVRNARGRHDPNPRIHAVVTFNLDALLEAYIVGNYEKRLLRVVERPSAEREPRAINCYHMHGYLRFDRRRGDRSKEAPDATVLTEQDYFDFFNQPTSLFNFTFLYLLREYPCCFIGLSMQDDNIRRLLHYAASDWRAALIQEGVRREADLRRRVARHYVILKRSGQAAIDDALSTTLRPLGVTPLWVADFAEIPARLGEVYAAAGEDWAGVF